MTAVATTVFTGKLITLTVEKHRLPDGKEAEFEIVRHPGGAAVVPLLPDGRVVLVRQFRPAVATMVLEIPAGKLDGGEAPEACIRRELAEEAGFQAGRLEKLGEMWSAVGFCDERIHLYFAGDLSAVPPAPDPDEYLEVVFLPAAEVLRGIEAGEIRDGKTQLAMLLARQRGLV